MINVLTVLRTGGDYDYEYVARVKAAMPSTVNFYCLTDDRRTLREPWALPLAHGWPGWWSKLELFRPDLPIRGVRLYFDLDTVFVRPLQVTTIPSTLAMLPGFNRETNHRDMWASGVMMWTGACGHIYKEALAAGAFAQSAWDQVFIADAHKKHTGFEPEDVTRCLPGIVSFKKHVRPLGGPPADARVVCFHGKPRPKDVEDLPWVAACWKRG